MVNAQDLRPCSFEIESSSLSEAIERITTMQKCIVYNANHEELDELTSVRGVVLVYFKECAFVIEEHPDEVIKTGTIDFPAPTKIVLKRYVDASARYLSPAHLNRHNLWIRDNYTCQYCLRHRSKLGRKESITKDHIMPRSRGGQHTWENIVAACSTCNNRKDNRTPAEANMRLRSKPYSPTIHEIKRKRKEHRHRRHVMRVVA